MAVNNWQKQVKDVLYRGHVHAKADGSVELRWYYYHRPGNLEQWYARIQYKLNDAGISANVVATNHWSNNPTNRYFCAIITPVE